MPYPSDMLRLFTAVCLMIELCSAASTLAAEPNFSPRDVLDGIDSRRSDCSGPSKLWVEVDGQGDCLRFYGAIPDRAPNRPVVFLEGDVVQQNGQSDAGWTVWDVPSYYSQLSPSIM